MLPLRDNVPTRRFPVITVAIIAINVVVYFVLQRGGISGPSNAGTVHWAAIPYEFTHPGDQCDLVGQSVACQGQAGVTGSASGQPPPWGPPVTRARRAASANAA